MQNKILDKMLAGVMTYVREFAKDTIADVVDRQIAVRKPRTKAKKSGTRTRKKYENTSNKV